LDVGDFQIRLPGNHASALRPYSGKTVVFGIRPEDIHDKALVPPSATELSEAVRLHVDVIEPMGAVSTVFLTAGSQTLVATLDAESTAKEGAPLDVVMDIDAAHVFDRETEEAII
jgi:multiple sugar transport system ATP-binding protein